MAPNPDEKMVLEDDKVKREERSEMFKQILKSNGISDSVSEVIFKDAGLKGERFASLTEYVTVKFENLEKKPLNLFVKVKSENASHNQMLDEMKAFEKEARFLTEYLKAAKEMCQLKGNPELMDFYPKCYYADGNMIVLENLVLDKGYQLKNKDEKQNLKDARVAIQTLAKHHAIGHAMIMEIGGPQTFFQKYQNLDHEAFDSPLMIPMMESSFTNCINLNIKILEKNPISGGKETTEKLKDFSENRPINVVLDALKTYDQNNDNKLLVLGHGDYWNNNMMFLMDNLTNKIVHQVAIDFQVTRYNSPSLDLGYYFFTSVQPHVRRANLLELLTLYKDTLNKVTEDLAHPTNLTIDQIFQDFRKNVGYGFWFGFVMSVGPGMGLYKDVDISTMDVNDWPVVMEELINKWIDENPEKGKDTAEEIVKLVEEYEQLKFKA